MVSATLLHIKITVPSSQIDGTNLLRTVVKTQAFGEFATKFAFSFKSRLFELEGIYNDHLVRLPEQVRADQVQACH